MPINTPPPSAAPMPDMSAMLPSQPQQMLQQHPPVQAPSNQVPPTQAPFQGQPGGDAPLPDEQAKRAELQQIFQELEMKKAEIENKKAISDNQTRENKVRLLKALFDALQEAGIDPNDEASIQNFLSQLEQQDPDLAALLDGLLNQLDPEMEGKPALGQEMPTEQGTPASQSPEGEMPTEMSPSE